MSIRLSVFTAMAFLFIACSGDAPAEITVQKDSATQVLTGDTLQISWADLAADTGKPGDVLMLHGYIGELGDYVEQKNGRMTVPLFERRNQRIGFRLNMHVKVGTRPNHVHELPSEFLPEDFKIVSDENNGDYVSTGSFVSVTAVKAEALKPGQVYAHLEHIFAVKAVGFLPAQSGAVRLTSAILKDTAQKVVYCFLEGTIELPEEIQPYTQKITLDLKNSSVPAIKTIEIPLGNGAGMMNDLPDNYTEDDLFIRDYKSSKIPYGSKVRIYGTWESNELNPGSAVKFYVEEFEVIGYPELNSEK